MHLQLVMHVGPGCGVTLENCVMGRNVFVSGHLIGWNSQGEVKDPGSNWEALRRHNIITSKMISFVTQATSILMAIGKPVSSCKVDLHNVATILSLGIFPIMSSTWWYRTADDGGVNTPRTGMAQMLVAAQTPPNYTAPRGHSQRYSEEWG